MNNKKNRETFVKKATKIILALNPTQILGQCRGDEYDHVTYVIPIGNNTYTVKLYNELDHKHCYNVYGRFETVVPNLGNQYSGKHNFHVNGNVNEVIECFKAFINTVMKTCK